MLALGANSLLNGLFTSIASNVVGGIVDAVTPTAQDSQFANLINSTLQGGLEGAPDISNLTNLSPDEKGQLINQLVDNLQNNDKIVNAANGLIQNLEGGIKQNGGQGAAIDSEALTQETLSVIEEILSTGPIVPASGNAQKQNAVLGQGNNSSLVSTSPINPLAAEGDIDAKLLAQQNLRKQNSIINNAQNQDKDLRLLGEENLKSIVRSSQNEILKDLNQVVDNGLFAKNNGNNESVSQKSSSYSVLPDGQIVLSENSEKSNILNSAVRTASEASKVANENFAYKIANISKKANEIEIKLEPETLGKLTLKLAFGENGKTNFIVMAEKADTLEMLKKDAAGLEKILSDNGIEADAGSMSFNLKGGQEQQQQQNAGEWQLFNRPVAFNIQELIDGENISLGQTSSIGTYDNLYSDNLLNIVV